MECRYRRYPQCLSIIYIIWSSKNKQKAQGKNLLLQGISHPVDDGSWKEVLWESFSVIALLEISSSFPRSI